jgi:hypothetical protein
MNDNPLQFIAPAAVMIVAILTIGGVAILRPLAKRAGDLLEAITKERREPKRVARPREEDTRLVELLEAMNARMERLEERQDFTDSLLGGRRDPQTLPARAGRDASV